MLKVRVLLFCVVCLAATSVSAQAVSGLRPGPHRVGYTVQLHADESRTYGDRVDATGRPVARPIQTSIWYPAQATQAAIAITFGDYVDSLRTELTSEPDENRKQQFLNRLRLDAFGPEGGSEADRARMERCLASPATALRDARPAEGRFPLVFYAPSFGREAFENSALCEFLASHGYVVVAVPCNGFSARMTPRGAMDVEALVRDGEFALEMARRLPYVDPTRTGVLGYSWGGTVSQFLAARNAHIQARVAMDGAEIAVGLDESVGKAFPFFDRVITTQIPSLVIFGGGSAPSVDLGVYDRTKYADTTFLRLASVNHLNFSYAGKLQLMCREATPLADLQHFDRTYSAIGSYVRSFLDAHLKGASPARAFLEQSPQANGFGSLLTVETRKGLRRPPMGDAFLEVVRREGGRKAQQILAEARKVEPGIVLVDDMSLWTLGQAHYLGGRTKEALEVFELWEGASAATVSRGMKNQIYEAIGKASLRLGEIAKARHALEKALEANPQNTFARQALDRLPK